MISIDEAITHAREVAERNRKQWKNCPAKRDTREHLTCEECAEEHEQLAEWLEELKELRKIKEDYAKGMQTSYATFMYKKAIDDFVEACENQFIAMYGQRYIDMRNVKEIAEQLKEGDGE